MQFVLAWDLPQTLPAFPQLLDLDVALSVMSSTMHLWFLVHGCREQKLQYSGTMVRHISFLIIEYEDKRILSKIGKGCGGCEREGLAT